MLSKILSFEYVFKVGSEVAWAALTAAVAVAAPIIAGADLSVVLADPKTWLIALAVACGRAAGVAAMVALRSAVSRLFA